MHVSRLLLSSALAASASAWNTIVLPPCADEITPFVYSGCFQDKGHSTLPFNPRLPSEGMTVAKCIASCKGNGFRYAGLEYYGECFCGASINGPSIGEDQCTYKCQGNSNDTCGGTNAISVWQDPTFNKAPGDVSVDDYKPLGCHSDDLEQGRALSQQLQVDNVTPEKCISACRANGYAYAGTQYGSECWCGAVLASGSSAVDESQCNVNCAGDATQKCGGGKRLSLYFAKELESSEPCGTTTTPPPETTTKTSSSPTDTTTSTPPPNTKTETTSSPPGTTSEVPPPDTTTESPPPNTTKTTSSPPDTTTKVPPPNTNTKTSTHGTSTKTTKTWETRTKTTTQPPPTGTCPAEPICKQVGKPVNGIPLPPVSCHKWELIDQFACLTACKIQFAKCLTGGHGWGKDANGYVGGSVGVSVNLNGVDLSQFDARDVDYGLDRRTFGLIDKLKCKWQLVECLKVNAFDCSHHCKDCKPHHGWH